MKFKQLSVDFSQVKNLDEMHDALAAAFDFPDFYGKNVNALIDCWSSLRFPEDEMSGITAEKDEVILLTVKGMSHMDQFMMNHFTIAVENVNRFSIECTGLPLILLLLV